MNRYKLSLHAKLVLGFTLTLSLIFISTYRWFYNLASRQLIHHNQASVKNILTAAMTGIDPTDIAGLIREGTSRADGHSDDTRYWNLVSWLSLIASTNPESQLCVFLPIPNIRGDRIQSIGCSANRDSQFLAIADNSLKFPLNKPTTQSISSSLIRTTPSSEKVWMRGVQPILQEDGTVIAYLGVALESSALLQVQQSTLHYLTLTFILTYIILVSLTYGLATLITRRVKILSQWASSVQQGDYSEKEGIPTSGLFADELDKLAIAFQSMNRAIKSREADLKASEEHLEQQVWERTQQLSTLLQSEYTVRTILASIQASFDETEILQTAVNELGERLSVLCANTGDYNYEKGIATVSTCYTSPHADVYAKLQNGRLGHVILFDTWQVYDILMTGESTAFCPLDNDFPVAILACPICDRTSSKEHPTIADIWLFKPSVDAFDPSEIRLARQVADVCAIAIRQARLYQQTQNRLTEVEAINQIKDDFLSTVSHELRTPITNMKMALQMLSMAMQSSLDQRQEKYLHILQDEVAREAALINDLLDLQKLDAGGMGFTFEPIDLATMLPSLLAPFESRLQERNLQLDVKIEAGLPPILSDISAFKRIVSELVNNACKYTPTNETIVVAAHHNHHTNHCITLSVTNFGAHLPDGECNRIFDKFYRIPRSDVWKQGGTGLGLALVKGLMEQLKGAIAVESQDNYVRFLLEFPQFLMSL